MKSCFASLRKSLPAVLFGAVVLLSISGTALSQSSAKDAVPVLEGLDPVMLVHGKEVQGELKITVTRGKFQYLFASAENKTTFEKDPARYEIQLEGACARMGAPVTGNPDLYSVHKGRIYIFGTEACKKRFDAAPTNYLENESGATAKPAVTPEAVKNALALIDKAVGVMGGAARIDGLISYQEKSTVLQTRRQGDVEVKTNLTVVFPDRIRMDQTMPDWNNPTEVRQLALVITPSEVFGIMSNVVRPLPETARTDQEKELKRRLIAILRARKSASFNPATIGTGKVGDTTVEQVAVEIDRVSYILGVDSATGRILSLSSWRRGPEGNFGEFVQVFSDFRPVDSLTLPFKITATFNGQPWKEQSPTIEAITVNSKIDPLLFERPKFNKAQ